MVSIRERHSVRALWSQAPLKVNTLNFHAGDPAVDERPLLFREDAGDGT